MKNARGKFAVGCFIWMALCALLSACIFPVAMMTGGISSTLGGDFVAQTLTPVICPDGSTGEIVTFATTTHDEYGNEQPATGYEMQCVDAGGNITREPSPDYAFIWLGFLAGAGVLGTAIIAFILAIPASMLINKFLGRSKKPEGITS
jgi:hypothetical protein